MFNFFKICFEVVIFLQNVTGFFLGLNMMYAQSFNQEQSFIQPLSYK